MYSFMTIIVVIVVGVAAGISYLIADYFFKIKENKLSDNGIEMSETIEYFISRNDHDTLIRYIVAVDRLIGARIWLFDEKYNLLAASYKSEDSKSSENLMFDFYETRASDERSRLKMDDSPSVTEKLQKGELPQKVHSILKDVYGGKFYKSQIFHPYYKEHVILVGVPYKNPVNNKTGAIIITEPLSGFEAFLRNIYVYVSIIGFVAIIISLFLVKKLSDKIIRPVLEMKDNAKAMASGDYTRRVQFAGGDEIAELGEALNSLGSDMEAYIDKMERTEKIRRDFVANVSHELRTPITIIRGYNEAICDGLVTDDESVKRYHGMISEETVRLERMVRELLDISRMQNSDSMAVEDMEELPLAAIIRNVVAKLAVKSAKRNVRFNVQVDETLKVWGDGDQMVQLVLILSDNALKYSPENGTVSLCAKKLADGSAVFSVSDQGPGIPEEDIHFIWERFYKVDKSHCRSVPGTGLGLAIAKEIIRVHGAAAEVISKYGQGTTFEIKFPKDKVV